MNPDLSLKTILLTVSLSLFGMSAYAQQEYTDYANNALLFSGSNLSGTARYQGLGGAQTALGADMGSLGGNPAGLGMYKKSEWSISSALGYAGTSAQFINNTTTDGKLNFNIPNVGIVFSGAKSEVSGGKWRGGSFGIGFTRQNSFQNQYSLDGVNNVSSILDRFVYDANNRDNRGVTVQTLKNEYDFQNNTTSSSSDGGATSMYFNAFLINPFFPSPNRNPNDTIGNQGGLFNTTYFQLEGPQFDKNGNETSPRSSARQQKKFNTTGAQSQWNISYGGNYDDRLYFGAALGITSLRYNYISQYDETYFRAEGPHGKAYNGITLNQDLQVRGTGVNLNLGVIYRANDLLRLGFSVLTPTFYKINETYNSKVDVDPYAIPDLDYNGYQRTNNQGRPLFVYLNDDKNFSVNTAPRTFDYNLTTPWRLSAGAAFFIGKSGFLSADVDYITYNGINLSEENTTFKNFFTKYTKEISSNLESAFNVRLGGELRHNIFRFRAGFGYQGDPYQEKPENNINRSRINLSLGAGVRLPDFYVDLAGTYSRYQSANTPYVLPNNPTAYPSALITNSLTNVVLTVGTFF